MTEIDTEHTHAGEPSTSAYVNNGCRHPDCKRVWAEYCAEAKRKRVAQGLAPDDHRHGTQTGYNSWGCRCEACSAIAAAGRAQGTYTPDMSEAQP